LDITLDGVEDYRVGDKFTARAEVELGSLTPKDVTVQLYIGNVGARGEFTEAEAIPMWVKETRQDSYLYEIQDVCCDKSGLHGITVRILPNHPDMIHPFIPGLATWAENDKVRKGVETG
jgi:starch phosphorylase